MSYGVQKSYTLDLTSGATLTSALNLGKPYNHVYLGIPAIASGSLYVQVASAEDGTYRRVYESEPNQDTAFVINSATTQAYVPLPPGLQFIKIESTSGATDTTTVFNFVCYD